MKNVLQLQGQVLAAMIEQCRGSLYTQTVLLHGVISAAIYWIFPGDLPGLRIEILALLVGASAAADA